MIPFTIAIPTYNRARFLKDATESVLAQTFQNFELLILDNASTDKTKEVARSFKDKRIRFMRNKTNIGMIGNWNRCIEESSGRYLMILGDDDKLYPNFLEETQKVYSKYPELGFTFTHCNKVDVTGVVLKRWGYDFPPAGYLKGEEYLFLTVKYGCCLTNSSTTVINKRVFKKVGAFQPAYGANTFDFNMWIKIADQFDVYFINKALADYRLHPEQVSEMHWRRPERQTGRIGSYLEIFDAITRLLNHKPYQIGSRKKFLMKRLLELDVRLAELLKQLVPEF